MQINNKTKSKIMEKKESLKWYLTRVKEWTTHVISYSCEADWMAEDMTDWMADWLTDWAEECMTD